MDSPPLLTILDFDCCVVVVDILHEFCWSSKHAGGFGVRLNDVKYCNALPSCCHNLERGSDYPDNSVTSHLFASGRRPDTAFQRYRNSRLGGEFHSEITGRSLSECLDECLRQTSFQCRSAVYSDRFRTCRLSRYNQRDGMRIIYDADYDYYENLMRKYRVASIVSKYECFLLICLKHI